MTIDYVREIVDDELSKYNVSAKYGVGVIKLKDGSLIRQEIVSIPESSHWFGYRYDDNTIIISHKPDHIEMLLFNQGEKFTTIHIHNETEVKDFIAWIARCTLPFAKSVNCRKTAKSKFLPHAANFSTFLTIIASLLGCLLTKYSFWYSVCGVLTILISVSLPTIQITAVFHADINSARVRKLTVDYFNSKNYEI